MPVLKFENPDLPKDSRTYVVDVPEGQNVEAVAASLSDSGWDLVEVDGAKPAKKKSAPEAQSAPGNPEKEKS